MIWPSVPMSATFTPEVPKSIPAYIMNVNLSTQKLIIITTTIAIAKNYRYVYNCDLKKDKKDSKCIICTTTSNKLHQTFYVTSKCLFFTLQL